MDELSVSMSVWLPVARANFYSSTANGWLVLPRNASGKTSGKSMMLDKPDYSPRLQVSVLRRLLEVLPVSFGYDAVGMCELNDEVDDLTRPVAVTMTLKPAGDLATRGDSPERRANLCLLNAGVREVTLRVDEHGAYTFTARANPESEKDVRRALKTHVCEVFGGRYSLDRRSGEARNNTTENGGGTAVRRYNGADADTMPAGPPRGILTFFQLNTLVEGMFNESLSPAVFFEQDEFLRDFIARQLPGSLTLIEEMGQVINLLVVDDIDAGRPEGLIVALRRFLDVTSREVLQRLKWSVESVRRSLLDETVGMLHRQSKLVQLSLGALIGERTPELAEGASESQLRGYVMLAAAKLPLVSNVYDVAVLTKDHLEDLASAQAPSEAGLADLRTGSVAPRKLGGDVERLDTQLAHWKALLRGLRNNIRGLESAIEHAWRERLLYEQQQVRSEQEAMAEIERSRAGRPTSERAGRNVYNFLMLVFAVVAVLVTIKTGNILQTSDFGIDWVGMAKALWPIAIVTVIFCLVVPLWDYVRQLRRDKQGESDSYPYEFAFRLEETADATKVHRYLNSKDERKLSKTTLKRLTVASLGGGRIERVTQDRALVKIHSTVTFKVAFARYARFEIVNEILAHRVSGKPTYVIVQCRMFGDSPRALKPAQILELARMILQDVGANLTTGNPQTRDAAGIDLERVLGLVAPLYSGVLETRPAVPLVGRQDQPALADVPAQRR